MKFQKKNNKLYKGIICLAPILVSLHLCSSIPALVNRFPAFYLFFRVVEGFYSVKDRLIRTTAATKNGSK